MGGKVHRFDWRVPDEAKFNKRDFPLSLGARANAVSMWEEEHDSHDSWQLLAQNQQACSVHLGC